MRPDAAYYGRSLWLPTSQIQAAAIRSSLTIPDLKTGEEILLYDEELESHIRIPRAYWPRERFAELPYPVHDVTPRFPRVRVVDNIVLRDQIQRQACSTLKAADGGVLQLWPGAGKTVIALKAWAEVGVPAIVIVGRGDLVVQWKQRIDEHLGVDSIGEVQRDIFDWEGHPITVASIQTLAKRALEGRLPPEFCDYFGVAIWDEAHHLSAPVFLSTADIFAGQRWGLTATPERRDGLESVYQFHLGPVIFSADSETNVPTVFFVKTGEKALMKNYLARNGDFSYSMLLSDLARRDRRNDLIADHITMAELEGRSILAISDRIAQLEAVQERIPHAGLITGKETNPAKRWETLQTHNIVLATTSIAQEAIDKAELDTIMILLPMHWIGRFMQAAGRIRRELEGKAPPFVVVFEDGAIKPCLGACKTIRAFCRDKGWEHEVIL